MAQAPDNFPYNQQGEYLRSVTNTVVAGDCIQVMNKLPAESAQLVFADPPFNLDKKYGVYRDNLPFDQYMEWTREWLEAATRILKPDGSLLLYNIPKMLAFTTPILNDLLEFRHWIAWNSGGKPLGRTLQPAHYGILFYTKDKKSKFFDVRAPHKECRKCQAYLKDYGGKEYMRHPFGYQISDVWDDIHRVRHASKRIDRHPCQLPVHLIERAILMTTDVGDMVVDPFCGGGSGAVAAKQMGRSYVGVEIDPYYQKKAQEKIDKAQAVTIGEAHVSIHLGKIVSIRDYDLEEAFNAEYVAEYVNTAKANPARTAKRNGAVSALL